jgi:hypothetical protein
MNFNDGANVTNSDQLALTGVNQDPAVIDGFERAITRWSPPFSWR